MVRSIVVAVLSLSLTTTAIATDGGLKHLYLCRSPLLAFDFWSSLQDLKRRGITLTPQIVGEICAGMKTGNEPQCLRVEASEFKPIASGWGGALSISDGHTKAWFHNPEGGGWIHPDYYISFVNTSANRHE